MQIKILLQRRLPFFTAFSVDLSFKGCSTRIRTHKDNSSREFWIIFARPSNCIHHFEKANGSVQLDSKFRCIIQHLPPPYPVATRRNATQHKLNSFSIRKNKPCLPPPRCSIHYCFTNLWGSALGIARGNLKAKILVSFSCN